MIGTSIIAGTVGTLSVLTIIILWIIEDHYRNAADLTLNLESKWQYLEDAANARFWRWIVTGGLIAAILVIIKEGF